MAVAIRSVDPTLWLWFIVACYTPFAPLALSKAGAQGISMGFLSQSLFVPLIPPYSVG